MLNIKRTGAFALLMAMVFSIYACKGEAMWLQAEDVCVFSAMEGTITFQGKPAVGAKIVRIVRWKDDKGESDTTVTNDIGHFSLPVMNRVLRRLFPVEFVAHQSIFVHYQGQEYHIWEMAKRDQREFGELGGKPVNFKCEITDEIVPVEVKRGLLVTSCTWDSISEVIFK